MLTSTFPRKPAVKWAEKTNEAVKRVQDDGLNILHTAGEAEDISIKVECNQVSICCICLQRNARPCCSLMETSVTFLTTIRDSWNLPASPSPPPASWSSTISESSPDLTDICHLHRPLSVGARVSYLSVPVREGEKGKRAHKQMLHLEKRQIPGSQAALLVLCLRHDAPPEPQTRGRCVGPTRTVSQNGHLLEPLCFTSHLALIIIIIIIIILIHPSISRRLSGVGSLVVVVGV